MCTLLMLCVQCTTTVCCENVCRQVLNEDSDIKGSAELDAAARTYMSLMDGIQATRKRVMCNVPAGLPATHSFPEHVVHFLSSGFKELSLFGMGRHVTVVKWSEAWWAQLYGLDVETLLSVDFQR